MKVDILFWYESHNITTSISLGLKLKNQLVKQLMSINACVP